MRVHWLMALIISGLIACNNSSTDIVSAQKAAVDSANFTVVKWLDPIQNLGAVTFGEKKEIKFNFMNAGDKPLYIISAHPGCGCTVADFPKGAINSGQNGTIVAAFDTKKSHPGHFKKTITVTTNTTDSAVHTLLFEGDIVDKSVKGAVSEVAQ